MSINQDIDSDLIVHTDPKKQKEICNQIQKLVKEKKETDLSFRIYNIEAFKKIVPFKKTGFELQPVKYTFYKTTRNKEEVVEFYNCYKHPEKFKFEWENDPLEFKYSVELSTDKSKLIKQK